MGLIPALEHSRYQINLLNGVDATKEVLLEWLHVTGQKSQLKEATLDKSGQI